MRPEDELRPIAATIAARASIDGAVERSTPWIETAGFDVDAGRRIVVDAGRQIDDVRPAVRTVRRRPGSRWSSGRDRSRRTVRRTTTTGPVATERHQPSRRRRIGSDRDRLRSPSGGRPRSRSWLPIWRSPIDRAVRRRRPATIERPNAARRRDVADQSAAERAGHVDHGDLRSVWRATRSRMASAGPVNAVGVRHRRHRRS